MDLDREKMRVAGWLAAAAIVGLLAVWALARGGDGGSEPVSVEPVGAGSGGGPAGGPQPGGADSGGAASGGAGSGGTAAGGPPPGAPAPGAAFVHVAGEVRRPGVYQVPRGGRVSDAVQLAGGMTRRAEQAGVNLVARVTDGQQVIVPRRGGGPPGAAPGAGGAAGAGGGAAPPGAKVSLATATVEQLDGVDGIGPTLAKRIVEYRDQHGGFRSVDELRQVDGIGEKRFESLREAVTP